MRYVKKINSSIKLALEWENEAREKKDTHGVKCAIDARRALLAMLSRVQDEPTIDAQPVKHGKWVDIGHNAGLKCSNCGKRIRYRNGIKNEITVTDGRFNHTHEASQNSYFNFCPKCGSYN